MITFIGGKDQYFGQFGAGLTSWLQRLSCTETPASVPPLPNGIRQHASECADGSDVVIYEAPEMGHHWPGAKQGDLALPDAGIDATAIMWEFFKNHQLER